MVHSIFCDHLNTLNDNKLPDSNWSVHACLQMHATSMHCGSQLAADCHLMHSRGHKNFVGRRSLENLYWSRFKKWPEAFNYLEKPVGDCHRVSWSSVWIVLFTQPLKRNGQLERGKKWKNAAFGQIFLATLNNSFSFACVDFFGKIWTGGGNFFCPTRSQSFF